MARTHTHTIFCIRCDEKEFLRKFSPSIRIYPWFWSYFIYSLLLYTKWVSPCVLQCRCDYPNAEREIADLNLIVVTCSCVAPWHRSKREFLFIFFLLSLSHFLSCVFCVCVCFLLIEPHTSESQIDLYFLRKILSAFINNQFGSRLESFQ